MAYDSECFSDFLLLNVDSHSLENEGKSIALQKKYLSKLLRKISNCNVLQILEMDHVRLITPGFCSSEV